MVGTRLPGPLASLVHQYPHIELELTTGISSVLIESLNTGKTDAIFVVDAPEDSKLGTNERI